MLHMKIMELWKNALRCNDRNTISYMVKKGWNVDTLIDDEYTALYAIILLPQYNELVYDLLKLGANPNVIIHNLSVLGCVIFSSNRNNIDIIRILLQYNADPNILYYGMPYFTIACVKYDLAVVELLILHGADVNIKSDSDITPLMSAVKFNRMDIARLLLDRGADLSLRSNSNMKAIDYATDEMITLLLQNRFLSW